MKTAIIGGGAAGFFAAICLKEQLPEMGVTIFEQKKRVLAKVEVSGGGRCNCTNTFASVVDLSAVYPRGHRLMKRLLKGFSHRDAYEWFQRHGVALTVQPDDCVFPASQDSHTIINCFVGAAHRLGIDVRTGTAVATPDELSADYDFVVVAVGGLSRDVRHPLSAWLASHGHDIVAPVPSLFTLRIDMPQLQQLMGTVADDATVMIPATSFHASGPLLITHWGVSGPAVLRLSSYAARYLADNQYKARLAINWTGCNEGEVLAELQRMGEVHQQKQLSSVAPFNLSGRLWGYLLERCLGEKASARWGSLSCGVRERAGNEPGKRSQFRPVDELGKKSRNRLVNILSGGDLYDIAGRAPFKDEFVTCGGVSLASVNPSTLESRTVPHLFFAGEALDIDGITGGFNFQVAWTTAYTVAQAIAAKCQDCN